MVLNLTPDKQHTSVVNAVMPLMKEGATKILINIILININ